MVAFYVEVVEQANEVLYVLVFLEELVEDGAVYHVVYDANVEVLALGFVGVVYFQGFFYIVFDQFQELLEILVKSDEDELQALCLVLCSIFSLPFDEMKQFTLEKTDALLEIARNDEVDIQIDSTSYDR